MNAVHKTNATPDEDYCATSLELLSLLLDHLPRRFHAKSLELLKKQSQCHMRIIAELAANGNAYLEKITALSTQRDNFQIFLMEVGRLCIREDFEPALPLLKQLDQFYMEFCGSAEIPLAELMREEQQKSTL